eukprot:COSAG02_NODE_1901_length_10451_cov_44.668566_5_plen_111_part_00
MVECSKPPDEASQQRDEALADAEQRTAHLIEADLPPIDVDGMSSPALMLMEFQREARSHFTTEVAAVLVDVLVQVEQSTGQLSAEAPLVWRPDTALQRAVIERSFKLHAE